MLLLEEILPDIIKSSDYLETCLKYESDRMVNLMLNQEDCEQKRL